MVTKGYGFKTEDIDWSSPADLEPYDKAHKAELKEKDEINWNMGMYVMYALDATVCNCEFWRNKGEQAHKYVQKPFMTMSEEKEYVREEYKSMSKE